MGQVLDGPALKSVLSYFGDQESEAISSSETVKIYGQRKSRRKKT